MKSNNKYDYLLTTIIAVSAFGFLGSFGTPIYPSRLFSLIVAPVVIYELNKGNIRIPSYIKNFFFIWIVLGILSLFWTYDLSAGLKAVLYHFCNFISFFAIYIFSLKSLNPVRSIFRGWILLLCLTAPFAIYEFSTGNHFSNALQDETERIVSLDGTVVQRKFASVTYGNLNSYNVIVCLCCSYILPAFFFFREKKSQSFLWLLLLIIVYIILMNASRGAFLCLGLSLTVFIYNLFKQKIVSKSFVLIMFALVVYIVISNLDLFLGQIFGRLSSTNIAEDDARMNIYQDGLSALADSYGLGVGLGGIESAIKRININGIGAMHNIFLEFLIQFGVIPFFFFIVFLYNIYIRLFRSSLLYTKILGTILCIIALPLFIIDSSYLQDCFVWIYWGCAFSLLIVSKRDA